MPNVSGVGTLLPIAGLVLLFTRWKKFGAVLVALGAAIILSRLFYSNNSPKIHDPSTLGVNVAEASPVPSVASNGQSDGVSSQARAASDHSFRETIDDLPVFPEEGPQPHHVMQDCLGLGNCWFLVVLQAFCKYPWFTKRITPLDSQDGKRRWKVRFNSVGKNEAGELVPYRDYIVDSDYTFQNGLDSRRLRRGRKFTCLWPLLFQDALIQHLGGSDFVSGRAMSDAISLFTQYPYEVLRRKPRLLGSVIGEYENGLLNQVREYLKRPGYDLFLGHRWTQHAGMPNAHAFVIESLDESGPEPMLTLIEPHSFMTYRHPALRVCPLPQEDRRDDSFPSQGRIVVPWRLVEKSEIFLSICSIGSYNNERPDWVIGSSFIVNDLQSFIKDASDLIYAPKCEHVYLGICQQPQKHKRDLGNAHFRLIKSRSASNAVETPEATEPIYRYWSRNTEQLYTKLTGLTIGENYAVTIQNTGRQNGPVIKGPVVLTLLYEKRADRR